MIEVKIDSIRLSLVSQERVIVLKDENTDHYIPIWIGLCEADAITFELQGMQVDRPMTHDLLKNSVEELGGTVDYIFISEIRNDVFYARIVIKHKESQTHELDARPSDAIALAVRTKCPIFVSESVIRKAGIQPEKDISDILNNDENKLHEDKNVDEEVNVNRLSAFEDFLNNLNIDLDDSDSD